MKEKANQPAIVNTTTDECYFPSRLIYKVLNRPALMQVLDSLVCVHQDPREKRLLVQCEAEAMDITDWNSAYQNKYKSGEPVVIATIRFPKADSMHVYLRCFERVTPILRFIDKYIPRSTAIGTHHDVCYKLITADATNKIPSPEKVFSDEKKIHYSDNMRRVDELEEKARNTGKDYTSQIDKLFEKDAIAYQSKTIWLNDMERKRLEVFYVDGASDYAQAMKVQQAMGLARHFSGGRLNVGKFFEKVMANEGKTITDMMDFLK